MRYYTLTPLHLPNAYVTTGMGVVFSSPEDTPITLEDIDMVAAQLKVFDVVDTTWVSFTVEAGHKTANLSHVNSPQPRHTAILCDHISPLLWATFDYDLSGQRVGFHTEGRVSMGFSLEEFRTKCPIVWAFSRQACASCAMNNAWDCRWSLLRKHLADMGVTNIGKQFKAGYRFHSEMRELEPVFDFPRSDVPIRGSRHIPHSVKEDMVDRAKDIGDFEYISAYYTHRYKRQYTKWKTHSSSTSGIVHNTDVINERRKQKSSAAVKAADNANRRKQLCGVGESAECSLSDECQLWRYSDRCTRLVTKKDFSEYAKIYFDNNPYELADVDTLHRSSAVSGMVIDMLNPYTGYSREWVVRGAVLRPGGKWVWTISSTTSPDEVQAKSWLELKQLIRRYAPWVYDQFVAVDDAVASRVCQVDGESHRLASLRARYATISHSAGFGYTSYKSVGVSVLLPAEPTNPDYVWEFTPTMTFEDGTRHRNYDIRNFVVTAGFSVLPKPTHFSAVLSSRLKNYYIT